MLEGACDIAEVKTGLIELENDDLMFSLGDDIGGVSNPFTVSGNVWPVSGMCDKPLNPTTTCVLT